MPLRRLRNLQTNLRSPNRWLASRKQPQVSQAGRRSPFGGSDAQDSTIRTYWGRRDALTLIAGWGLALMVSDSLGVRGLGSAIGMKPALVGSYSVNGTDADGVPYSASQIVDIYLAPSGARELDWNNGKHVVVGQVIDDVLAVASMTKVGP